jgi:hypothetical protein
MADMDLSEFELPNFKRRKTLARLRGDVAELVAEARRVRRERNALRERVATLEGGIERRHVLTMATIQRMAGDAAAQMDECSYHDGELWSLLDVSDDRESAGA